MLTSRSYIANIKLSFTILCVSLNSYFIKTNFTLNFVVTHHYTQTELSLNVSHENLFDKLNYVVKCILYTLSLSVLQTCKCQCEIKTTCVHIILRFIENVL